MTLEKNSNIMALVLSSVILLGSLSIFLGQMCTKLITDGFFAYLLNIFSAPINLLFPLFVSIFGSLKCLYAILGIFFVLGILAIAFTVAEMRHGERFSFRITRYVFSCICLFFCACAIASLVINGFSILSDQSIWSGFYLFIVLILGIADFVVRTILLVKTVKEKKEEIK